ncbi:MAG TPA: hypothetical protein VJJ51_08905 [Candidatus Methanoperedens sp.]|nr:hypothetical protein [Candidatus Methanoperedens sp.]
MVEIDFFTLGAQIINFLVLVLLLRHFLYRRVVRAMDEREARIDSRLKEAQERKKEAEQEAESYRKKNQELLDRDEELLAKAREEADIWRKKLEENARIEVEENKARWYEAVERQKEAFLIDLRRRAGEQTYIIVRRVLKDLANDDLERQIINTFIKLLANLEDDEKEAIKAFDQGIIIRSAFEIPEIMRRMVEETVRDQIGNDSSIRFETAPDLICGIELHARDRQITWSLASYLDALEEDISRALEQR